MGLLADVQTAIPWVPGFDCDVGISAVLAQAFYGQGYKFVSGISREGSSILKT
jgi:hypothetical protein